MSTFNLSGQSNEGIAENISHSAEDPTKTQSTKYIPASSAQFGFHIQTMDEDVSDELEDNQLKSKRLKTDDLDSLLRDDISVKQLLFNINKAICLRLDAIENKLDSVIMKTNNLDLKIEGITNQMKANAALNSRRELSGRRSGAVIVGLPQGTDKDGASQSSLSGLGPNVQLITLNTEDDYPHGTWLGDESNIEMRVRVPVTPSDLLHIHSNCRTPEKMALTLLDYLFDRDTQALSNISGLGKHGKHQLDPLMIYGIRCHLIHRFSITEVDWNRIKQNIDSKCRTAFRRKVRGQSLSVKAFRGKSPASPGYMQLNNIKMEHLTAADNNPIDTDEPLTIQQVTNTQEDGDEDPDMQHTDNLIAAGATAEIIQTSTGEIQVLHATPEQLAQLQQANRIQILQGEGGTQVMAVAGENGDAVQLMGVSRDGLGQVVDIAQGVDNQVVDISPVDEVSASEDDDAELVK